jgi:hypothetical protein
VDEVTNHICFFFSSFGLAKGLSGAAGTPFCQCILESFWRNSEFFGALGSGLQAPLG